MRTHYSTRRREVEEAVARTPDVVTRACIATENCTNTLEPCAMWRTKLRVGDVQKHRSPSAKQTTGYTLMTSRRQW